MKIALLGKNGQVGHELRRTLLSLGRSSPWGGKKRIFPASRICKTFWRSILPISSSMLLPTTPWTRRKATRPRHSASTPKPVGLMAEHAHQSGALLVHYSIDYVFDGEKPAPYVETDAMNPHSAYGRSKRAGEQAIEQSGCRALIFRTSWVFSAHGGNFIKTILRLAKERDNLNIVADQIGAPTSAELIADVTALAIAGYRWDVLPCGLYHLTASGATSWHGLACHVVNWALANGATLKLNAEPIHAIPTEAFPFPAKRLKNSRMDTGALSSALGLYLPNWNIHVDRVVDQLS